MTDDEYWAAREEHGYDTGHIVGQCANCNQRQMVAYRPRSQPMPRCRVCLEPSQLVIVSDLTKIRNKRPGQGLTDAQLRRRLRLQAEAGSEAAVRPSQPLAAETGVTDRSARKSAQSEPQGSNPPAAGAELTSIPYL